MNYTMVTNRNGSNVGNEKWKATTAKNDDKKKRYWLTKMMPGRVRVRSLASLFIMCLGTVGMVLKVL